MHKDELSVDALLRATSTLPAHILGINQTLIEGSDFNAVLFDPKGDDPIEHTLPQTRSIQRVSVSDGINQQRWLLGDRKEEDTYQRWREQQNSAMEQSLKQANISRYHISAGLPLDTQIQGMQQERF